MRDGATRSCGSATRTGTTAFEDWEGSPTAIRPDWIFLAEAEGRFVGMVSGLDWCFTGVHPTWQGRGIATVLKVWALSVAKTAELEAVETENHEDNAAMLAINRKVGFTMGPVEIQCRRPLESRYSGPDSTLLTIPSVNGPTISPSPG